MNPDRLDDGAVKGSGVVADLYDVADGRSAQVLDELLVAARYRWVCGARLDAKAGRECGWRNVGPDVACADCGAPRP